jgi:hypothetical protein
VRGIIIVVVILGALAAFSAKAAGGLAPGWNLVPGTGQAPADYAAGEACTVGIYGWDGAAQRWERWGRDVPAWVNTLTRLEVGRAYWVECD